MDEVQIHTLLTLASSIDSRKVSKEMRAAWLVAAGDIPFEVARKALELHWRESSEWLLPVHIRRLADRAQEFLALEQSRAAQQDWLDTLGLTMADYTQHWDEPGWLDEQQRRFDSIKALGAHLGQKAVER